MSTSQATQDKALFEALVDAFDRPNLERLLLLELGKRLDLISAETRSASGRKFHSAQYSISIAMAQAWAILADSAMPREGLSHPCNSCI